LNNSQSQEKRRFWIPLLLGVSLGINCEECASDGGFFCLTLYVDSMTAEEIGDASLVRERSQRSAASRGGQGKGGRSRPNTDLMAGSEVELADDFAKRIRQGREQKGWDQRTLALRMKERINEVKRAESGHRPSDKVLTKFEKSLDIVLMEVVDGGYERHVKQSIPRSLNLGDILDAAKRESD